MLKRAPRQSIERRYLQSCHWHRSKAPGNGIVEGMSAPYRIRHYGDPVLKQVAKDVTEIDGSLARLVDDMLETMYDEPGLGLAAPQVGIRKRLFVYDLGPIDEEKVGRPLIRNVRRSACTNTYICTYQRVVFFFFSFWRR